jgi:hypothetical protein
VLCQVNSVIGGYLAGTFDGLTRHLLLLLSFNP